MKQIILLCAFAFLSVNAVAEEDINQLIRKLGDENYDVRVETSEKLCGYREEFIPLFLKMAKAWENDPEISWRLKEISKIVWERTVLINDVRYKRLNGCIGVELTHNLWLNSMLFRNLSKDERDPIQLLVLGVSGVFADSPVAGKIDPDDWIQEIDGKCVYDFLNDKNSADYGLFEIGHTYKLKVMHQVRHEIQVPNPYKTGPDDGMPDFIPRVEIETQEKECEITAYMNEPEKVDQDLSAMLYKTAWNEYLEKYKKEYDR